jgi:hypothetical protein
MRRLKGVDGEGHLDEPGPGRNTVRSATHSWLGLVAEKSRSTRSVGRVAAASDVVSCGPSPRRWPSRCSSPISRSTGSGPPRSPPGQAVATPSEGHRSRRARHASGRSRPSAWHGGPPAPRRSAAGGVITLQESQGGSAQVVGLGQSNGWLSELARSESAAVKLTRMKYGPGDRGRGTQRSRLVVSRSVVASSR